MDRNWRGLNHKFWSVNLRLSAFAPQRLRLRATVKLVEVRGQFMTLQTPRPVKITPEEPITVSDETKAIVERNLPEESDEVKQKFGELIDAIKRQATREIESVETMSRETYVQAIENAQQTLNRAQTFLQAQEVALEDNVNQIKDEANHKWESTLADIRAMGDRVDRAINAAWMILTESEK